MRKSKFPTIKQKIIQIIFIIFIVWISVAFYQTHKSLPDGISYEGEIHQIQESDIDFLYDLTYINNNGSKIIEQEIFQNIFNAIDNAEQFIIIDMFLFNANNPGNKNLIPLTETLTRKLIEKKKQNSDIQIFFITDEINNFYGSYTLKEIQEMKDNNIQVVITDPTKLRDSNPWYSSIWRTYFQWFGTSGSGFITHPLGNTDNKVTLRSFLRLFNTKANHRKILVADSENTTISIVASANPHDGSSLHSNTAFLIKGPIASDLIKSEQAVAQFSGGTIPNLEVPKTQEGGELTAQLLTEGKIEESILKDLSSMQKGEEINLAMFYLSNRDIVESLIQADQRGVQIKIILDPNKDAFAREKSGVPNRQVALELLEKSENIELRWYNTQGEQFHTKILILKKKDITIIYTGSPNYTRRNLSDLNLESLIKVTSPKTASLSLELDSYFNRLWINEDGIYTLDFEAFKDTSKIRILQYRFQEWSGFSTF